MMIDWDSVKNEALTHLQNLIRINTTNPPGNEIEAIRYLSEVLKKEGIDHQIFLPAPGRGNLVARLQGNGNKRPLLLTSHVDVVPAEKEKWKVDPFSGEIRDGFVWGRGTLDMKQMTAMELMMVVLAKRNNIPLSRDLILAAVSDEEEGCYTGSRWLVGNKPSLIDAEYALNEVGGFSLYLDDEVFYPIGVAERGICWFKLTTRGEPGHASMPHNDQAVVKLARLVEKVGEATLPFHLHPVVKQFVLTLSQAQKGIKRVALKGMLSRLLNSFIIRYLIRDDKRARQFYALFHNTAAATLVRAGEKINVIPSHASVHIDGRILPGETMGLFLAELKKVIGEDFDFELIKAWDPEPPVPQDSFFDLLCATVKTHHPGSIPVPYLMPGFTDASQYSRLGIKCYGFSPVKLERGMQFSELFHGHNERIPVEGFLFGLKVLWDVVCAA